jgi:hypothetical protein
MLNDGTAARKRYVHNHQSVMREIAAAMTRRHREFQRITRRQGMRIPSVAKRAKAAR